LIIDREDREHEAHDQYCNDDGSENSSVHAFLPFDTLDNAWIGKGCAA
jgi:hypothetical protein